MSQATGLDVSHHNVDPPKGPIDWHAVRLAGYDFVFIKSTRADGTADPKYPENYEGARSAGFLVGAYGYWTRKHDPVHFAQQLVLLSGKVHFPLVLDLEDPEAPADGHNAPSIARAIQVIQQQTNQLPLIYSSPGWWNSHMPHDSAWGDKYRLWVAHWTTWFRPRLPAPWSTWTFWQHTAKGSIPGVTGAVDLNRFNGDLEALRRYAGELVPTPPDPIVVTVTAPKGVEIQVIEE